MEKLDERKDGTDNKGNYTLETPTVWKNTLNDGLVKFKEVKPAIQEKTAATLKKQKEENKYELTEANCIRNLKIEGSTTIQPNKVYYYPSQGCCYTVLSVQKDSSGKPSKVKLSKHGNTKAGKDKEIELDSDKDISSLRDYVMVNVRVYSDTEPCSIISTPIKLQNKLETELTEPMVGATGKSLTMSKLFHNSKAIDKESTLASECDNIEDNMILFATSGFSKSYKFKRFPKPYPYPYWGYYGTSWDGIAFIPNQNVILNGFTVYSTESNSFQLRYKIYVDDVMVEEEECLTLSDWEEKYYKRISLKGLHEVKAGAKLEISVQIAENFQSNGYVSCFYGDCGDQFKDVENDHMGLWTVDASSKSCSSGVYSGNIPEIMYYL